MRGIGRQAGSGRAGFVAQLTLLAFLSAFTANANIPQAQSHDIDHARLWRAYISTFISSDGRVLDPQTGNRTTSEGQSYALFFALVNNDRPLFNKLLAWTQNNLASGDLATHLPAWSWGQKKDGHWGTLDPNSAADSDLWIAYDLLEAGRLWNSPKYSTLGRQVATQIASREVADLPGFGEAIVPGPTGFRSGATWVLNPSYSPVFLLDRLALGDSLGIWASVSKEMPSLIERSTVKGFAMDWVCYTPGHGFSPCVSNGQKPQQPMGSYDAIRVYLWAGMLPETNGAKARLLKALPGMGLYLGQHSAPPEKVNSDGIPGATDGPVGFSAGLLPYLQGISAESSFAQQLVRIKSQLNEKSNLYGTGFGSGPTYYDQNLVLFGSGWIEKRFQFESNGELLVRWSR